MCARVRLCVCECVCVRENMSANEKDCECELVVGGLLIAEAVPLSRKETIFIPRFK